MLMDDQVDFRPVCSRSGEEMALVCDNLNCNSSAFTCGMCEGCIEKHNHTHESALNSWRNYALPMRRALEVHKLPKLLEKGIRERWE